MQNFISSQEMLLVTLFVDKPFLSNKIYETTLDVITELEAIQKHIKEHNINDEIVGIYRLLPNYNETHDITSQVINEWIYSIRSNADFNEKDKNHLDQYPDLVNRQLFLEDPENSVAVIDNNKLPANTTIGEASLFQDSTSDHNKKRKK